jgi:hypothetical protein
VLLEIKANYIVDEIDIRVKSIRIEIEEDAKRLKDELMKMKNEVIKKINPFNLIFIYLIKYIIQIGWN